MDTRDIEQDLAVRFKYKPLSKETSDKYRKLFLENIPEGLLIDGNISPIRTKLGTVIARSYSRIVIGDYGAFVEIPEADMIQDVLMVEPGQEYRMNDIRYSSRIKYWWFTCVDGSGIKIYFQVRTVLYADYKVNCFYVSVHDIQI